MSVAKSVVHVIENRLAQTTAAEYVRLLVGRPCMYGASMTLRREIKDPAARYVRFVECHDNVLDVIQTDTTP